MNDDETFWRHFVWLYQAQTERQRWWALSVAAFALLTAVCIEVLR